MDKRSRRIAGSKSAGEKQPEPGEASVEQMADCTNRMVAQRDEKPADTGGPMIASQVRGLDRSLQKRIGSVLRESFADIEKGALPERLQDLIKALQAKEQSRR